MQNRPQDPSTALRIASWRPQNAAFGAAKINENTRILPQNRAFNYCRLHPFFIGPDFFAKVAVSRYGRFKSFAGAIRGFPCPGTFGEAIAKSKSIYLRRYERVEPENCLGTLLAIFAGWHLEFFSICKGYEVNADPIREVRSAICRHASGISPRRHGAHGASRCESPLARSRIPLKWPDLWCP